MKSVFQQLEAHLLANEPCVLVSAVGGEGSVPRKTESHMLVDSGGRVCGTVGGGAVEGKSIEYAIELLTRAASDLRTFELCEHAADDIGMICGGSVRVHFRYVPSGDEAMLRLARGAIEAFSEGISAYLIVDLINHDITLHMRGKWFGDKMPVQLADALDAQASTLHAYDKPYYREQLVRGDRVYIFGGGHVAQALVPVLASVDFRCVIIEDREEFADRALFPQAHDVLMLDQKDWRSVLNIGPEDCICIMTRGHKNDLDCQAFALETQAGYIGVIGSRRKVASVNARLKEMGFSDQSITRIVTPIGLEIGAVTPAEIAVSIAAQLIAHRAKGKRIQKSCMS